MLGNPEWRSPKLIAESNEKARPGYKTYEANEYLDYPEVLDQKILLLSEMIKASKNFIVYTGAGISVSAGLGDYATKSKNTISGKQKLESINRLQAKPTISHYILTGLH